MDVGTIRWFKILAVVLLFCPVSAFAGMEIRAVSPNSPAWGGVFADLVGQPNWGKDKQANLRFKLPKFGRGRERLSSPSNSGLFVPDRVLYRDARSDANSQPAMFYQLIAADPIAKTRMNLVEPTDTLAAEFSFTPALSDVTKLESAGNVPEPSSFVVFGFIAAFFVIRLGLTFWPIERRSIAGRQA